LLALESKLILVGIGEQAQDRQEHGWIGDGEVANLGDHLGPAIGILGKELTGVGEECADRHSRDDLRRHLKGASSEQEKPGPQSGGPWQEDPYPYPSNPLEYSITSFLILPIEMLPGRVLIMRFAVNLNQRCL
jgi:hypothetical protein